MWVAANARVQCGKSVYSSGQRHSTRMIASMAGQELVVTPGCDVGSTRRVRTDGLGMSG
jgi:hypothetical protein